MAPLAKLDASKESLGALDMIHAFGAVDGPILGETRDHYDDKDSGTTLLG
jgi:hypothetical protein